MFRLRWLLSILGICIVCTASAGEIVDSDLPSARQRRIAGRVERHRLDGKENNVFLTLSSSFTAHNQVMARFKLEYSRQIRGGLFWGCSLSAYAHSGQWQTFDCGDFIDCYRNTVDQNVYKLDGMVFYRLPVIRSRLFFRVGAGAGLGWHRIRSISDDHRQGNRILPYLNVEGAWILRIAKGFEMKFSPTILLLPSEFSFSPVKLGAPTDVLPWIADLGFSLTLGWRF